MHNAHLAVLRGVIDSCSIQAPPQMENWGQRSSAKQYNLCRTEQTFVHTKHKILHPAIEISVRFGRQQQCPLCDLSNCAGSKVALGGCGLCLYGPC